MSTPPLPYQDTELNINKIEEEAFRLICVIKPHWATKKLTYKKLTDDVSNSLLGMFPTSTDNSDKDIKHGLVCKVYGNNSDLIIDREKEIRVMVELAQHQFANQILLKFKNGFFYGYVPGKPIDCKLVRDERISLLIARRLAEFHSVTSKLEFLQDNHIKFSQLSERLRHYFNLLNGTNPEIHKRLPVASTEGLLNTPTTPSSFFSAVKQFFGYSPPLTLDKIEDVMNYKLTNIDNEIKQIDIILKNKWSYIQMVNCHHGTQCQNFLYDEKLQQINIIDFEHCMFNYWLCDITNHFIEFAGLSNPDWSLYPNRTFQKRWLKTYLQYAEFLPEYIRLKSGGINKLKPTDIELECLCDLIGKLIAPCHLYWALWAFVEGLLNQSSTTFDYSAYGKMRFQQYLAHKETFLTSLVVEEPKEVITKF
ncbi:unnamed protein product [Didymodactylos carnosus]|uniref:ethanolamine kinase n=1 Tax=Didymodactylos carnosus TaxID=1234261 RepID=A0A813Q9I4_9BILA|nr:unnamed protein product [Didymodactylos carnosus]CAF0764055.1 unnamed protein product [Didymodactylos carnosus]CAF3531414.1 unnamed protein product [Didymodactylos carnosus]CAF3545216.1 unnamed protein product [Didymodactylos carnosus]